MQHRCPTTGRGLLDERTCCARKMNTEPNCWGEIDYETLNSFHFQNLQNLLLQKAAMNE